MSDYGLAEQLGVTVKEAKSFIEKYFEKYAEIKDYMNKSIAFGKENGYVSTVLNRKRYIPEINEKNYMRQEFGKRLAMNSPIQGSAADIIKLAMIKVDQLLKENHMKSKMILQVHDELIFDVYQDELDNNNAWEIMKLLEEINSKGTTVIVVTHNLEIVKVMKKRVITVKKGTIVSDSKEGGYDDEN